PEGTVGKIFPQKAPPVPTPSRPEPRAPDASPLLTPEMGPPGALWTHGADVRTRSSGATNVTPRLAPAAAGLSGPESPRTASAAPRLLPAGRRCPWRAPRPPLRSCPASRLPGRRMPGAPHGGPLLPQLVG